ncbi:MAG: TetR/AcrR family transcriptional regulator [Euryarchaeota archaeon]|nr:TetR/AcrR family transcriptional regulator [Euryarchaeota archaeon]MBU4607365.1 TetR/AcrR family transcriptional regulator [Euryarchaeota archaeon]MBV1754923.1 TetR/AcrR family transcriptional regulator [Methanobacterium sp.]MBV1768339.1 TetR/AcrR family transcriptional regulator [Methanobacterium sp.]
MPVNLKEQKREQRRKYILDVAEKLFFIYGYDDVSMNDISHEIGLNKTVIYRFFKNKEALYFAVVLRGVLIFSEMLKSKVHQGKTGIGKLQNAGRAYFEFYKKYPEYHDAYLYSKSKRFSPKNIEASSEINSHFDDIMKTICDVIQEGIQDGTMRKNLNPLEVAVFVAVTAERIVELSPETVNLLEKQGINHEKFIDDAMDLWRHMVMNPLKE